MAKLQMKAQTHWPQRNPKPSTLALNPIPCASGSRSANVDLRPSDQPGRASVGVETSLLINWQFTGVKGDRV